MTSLATALQAPGQDDMFAFHLRDGVVPLSRSELLERADRLARQLVTDGVGPGDVVGVLGPNRPEWVVSAFACWLVGASLVPVQLPMRIRDPAAFVERVHSLVQTAGCKVVLTDDDLVQVLPDGLARSWHVPDHAPDTALPVVGEDALAVIQFTSGSTSTPKGVLLSHRAVWAEAAAIGALTPDPTTSRVLGWAPFFHDLGLFFYVVVPFFNGATSDILPTELYARDPGRWLGLVKDVRATILVGPQSAWAASVASAARRGLDLDLSSVQTAWFAAEAVDATALDTMQTWADDVGLSPAAIGSTYGLAEATLAVTASRHLSGARVLTVDRDRLAAEEVAVPIAGPGRRVVSAGHPLVGTSVRITVEGQAVPDGHVGDIEVDSPSVMSGYLRADGRTSKTPGEWLDTGDLGFLHDGELFVTGRKKDVLIVLGQNYYPDDFEWAANRVDGVRPGRSVALLAPDRNSVVLVVEPRPDQDVTELASRVRGEVAAAVGAAPTRVVVAEPGTLEKTTSGKPRRSAMQARLEVGEL